MNVMQPIPETYFRQFIPKRDAQLIDLEKQARAESIPIIGPVVGELLFILTRVSGARKVLELGTAFGYSTVFLAQGLASDKGQVTTVEYSPGLIKRARANFETAGLSHLITQIEGDSRKVLTSLNEAFDIIFLDIDKAFYIELIDDCVRLLKEGGLLIADNVGFQDADNYNRAVFDHSKLRVVHLFSFLPDHSPEKDGISFALKV